MTDDEEPKVEILYTLEEARLAINQEKCTFLGHDFMTMLSTQSNDPVSISCQRCGKLWSVSPQ